MPRTGIAQRLYEEKVSGAKRDRPELVRIQAMHHPAGVTRIADASCQARPDIQPVLDFAQRQQTTVGRHALAIKASYDHAASDR
jgi:hypothetical protein